MNPCTIIPKDTVSSLTLIVLQVISVLGAGYFLFTARFYPIAVVPAVLLLGLAVFLGFYSRHRLFSLLVIALLTSLILSLRFDFLAWGDPWYDYGMIQQIITYQILNPSIYTSQYPVLHVLIVTCSFVSNVDPLSLQKFVIPTISLIGVYMVYKITQEISSAETAFFAGLLLLCGTPYLHWTTQGVRETIGLALFVLVLYICIRAIQYDSKRYLFLSVLLIGGLVLTHNLSMGIFLLVWLAFSLTFLYLVCDLKRMRKAVLFSLIITITSVVLMIGWWSAQREWVLYAFNGMMNRIFFCDYGIPFFLAIIILLCLIPLLVPEKIHSLRSFVQHILQKKDVIYKIFILITVIGCIIVLYSILGNSVFSVSYPLPMLFNGICMVVFSLIGLYYFLDKDRLPVLAWVAVLSVALILSLGNIIQIEDRIRFIEFLYIPLSIIAAFGLSRIAQSMGSPRFFPILVTVFVVISVVTAFPSVVFFGQPFEPGHPLYDNRSWVIQHHATEISAISWLDTSRATGVVDTDAYVGYAARGIALKDSLLIQSGYPFMRERGYSQSVGTNVQQHYLLILSRMKIYTEFGIQWLQKKEPLNDADLQKINYECNLLYTNGDAEVYSYFSNVTSEYYYYYIKPNEHSLPE